MQPNLVHRVVVVGVSAAGVVVAVAVAVAVVVAAVVVVEFVARPFVGIISELFFFHFEESRCRNFLFTTWSRNSKRRLVFYPERDREQPVGFLRTPFYS